MTVAVLHIILGDNEFTLGIGTNSIIQWQDIADHQSIAKASFKRYQPQVYRNSRVTVNDFDEKEIGN